MLQTCLQVSASYIRMRIMVVHLQTLQGMLELAVNLDENISNEYSTN